MEDFLQLGDVYGISRGFFKKVETGEKVKYVIYGSYIPYFITKKNVLMSFKPIDGIMHSYDFGLLFITSDGRTIKYLSDEFKVLNINKNV